MRDRLKVLFITPSYPNKTEPALGIFVREYAKAVNVYNDVVVFHVECVRPSLKELWSTDLETDETFTEGIVTYRVQYPFIPKLGMFSGLWSVLQAIKRAASDGFEPDVIHAHVCSTGFPGVVIGGIYGLPVVITEHSGYFLSGELRRGSVELARFAFRRAAVVLPVSRALQRSIQAYGIKARFQVVPNAVDTTLFYPSEQQSVRDPKRLLLVTLMGRGHENKRVFHLLQALIHLRARRDDWHLDIIGYGSAQAEYEQMVCDLQLNNHVTFHGYKPKQEVAEFMRQCDILVSSSLSESFGITLIEALASGKPVVATKSGGPEDTINDDVGRLVPCEDASALADAIDYVFDHYDDYPAEKIARYAKERYSHEVVGKQIDEIYRNIIHREGKITGTWEKAKSGELSGRFLC